MSWNWLDDVAVGLLAGLLAIAAYELVRRAIIRRRLRTDIRERRVLFPFAGRSLSYGALDAAIRLANAEYATLVPAYLARVPMRLGLDAAISREAEIAVELLEAIEQRALRAGVPVDARITRGRTGQHALQELTRTERYYRMVLPAATRTEDGLTAQAIAWALEHAPGEIVVLRPGSAPEPVLYGRNGRTRNSRERSTAERGRRSRRRERDSDLAAPRNGSPSLLLRPPRHRPD